MTLVEMAIVVLVLGGGLFLLSGWMSNGREQARRDLVIRMMADLDKALARYHRATGVYPGQAGGAGPTAVRAVTALAEHERTRSILEAFPSPLWLTAEERTLTDAWGTPLHYLPATADTPVIKANNGRPVFVSAGPDRIFGEDDPAGLGDDLRSDDPGPDGFRLQHALREAIWESDKEQSRGEEDD